MMVLVPPPPPFSPLQDSPGFLALCSLPVSSLFVLCLPSVCVWPSPSSSVWSPVVRPTNVSRPPADCRLMPSPGFQRPIWGFAPSTCAAGGTWLGCGWRGSRRRSPPRSSLSSSTLRQASPGVCVFSVSGTGRHAQVHHIECAWGTKISKRFYIKKSSHFVTSKTICVTFLYTKRKKLSFTQFFILFLKLEFIHKKHDTLRYMTFLYTKIQTRRKKQDNLRYVLIYKNRTLYVTRFFIEFLKLVEGGGIFICKKNSLCVTFLYRKNNALCIKFFTQKWLHHKLHLNIQKTMHFALHFYTQKMHFALLFYIQKAWHFTLIFNMQKTVHFALRFYILNV